jgi:colanic acid/amylovoran biosynthesis glycosyltransferase
MIAFVSQRFPAATETFTYDEAAALSKAVETVVFSFRPGVGVDWPLDPPTVQALSQRPFPYAASVLYWLVRHPMRLLRTVLWAIRGPFLKAPSRRERVGALLALARGAYLARLPDVRLYHAQFADNAATAALIAAELSGRRFSFRSHTSPNPQLLRKKLRRAALVLSISGHDKAFLDAIEPRSKVVVSKLGVAIPEPPPPPELGLIGAVGSLIEKKGHSILLAACAELRRRGVAFRCEIAGDGPMRARLEKMVADEGLVESVVLRGLLTRDEVHALLARSEIVALASVPSDAEGTDGVPVALMEALALGRPCVSTRTAGIPELVIDGTTGLLVPPHDPFALADALQALLEDPERARELGQAGRELVSTEYEAGECFRAAAEWIATAAG